MKLINYKVKILAIIIAIIGFSFLMSNSAYAIEDWIVGKDGVEPCERNPEEYCGEHVNNGVGILDPSVEGVDNLTIQFDNGTAEDMDPAVGYARYAGYTGMAMQKVIWDHTSNNIGAQENSGDARPKTYKLVYNEIFSKLKKGQNLIKNETKEEDLKVLVDRVKGTYTVGPYKVNLSVNASTGAVKALYEELTQKHDYPFAEFSGISGINGTNIEVLDRGGNKISSGMPELGQAFYIRFKPNENGAIPTTGNPQFKIRYIAGFKGKVIRYKEKTLKGNINITAGAGDISVDTNNIGWNDPAGASIQTGSKTVKIKYEAKITSDYFDEKTVSESKDVTVTFSREVYYDEYGNITGYGNIATNYDDIPAEITIKKSAETFTGAKKIQDIIKFSVESGYSIARWAENTNSLPEAVINMQLGGKVWKDVEQGPKNLKLNGRKDKTEEWFAGIEVSLYEKNGEVPVAVTTTDKNGVYRFFGKEDGKLIVNPLKEYYVVFRYNGQIYESTYYKNNLTGGYSNAKDVAREDYNKKFETISAYPNNYGESKVAYGWEQKIKNKSGDYIQIKRDGKDDALRFKDIYSQFLVFSTNKDFGEAKKSDATTEWTYTRKYGSNDQLGEDFYVDGKKNKGFGSWLLEIGLSKTEKQNIINFIYDSLMSASTHVKKVTYSVYDKFVLENIDKTSKDYKKKVTPSITFGNEKYTYIYSRNSDQARNVDFGLHERVKTNLAIQKDIYKATVIVNGKKEDYIYNRKALNDDGVWTVNVRASDYNYNPSAVYDRPIKQSDYLYDGKNDTNTAELRKIRMYVTYRITVRNVGNTKAVITGLKDYFDPAQYAHDRSDAHVNEGTYSGMQNFGTSLEDIMEAQKASKKGDISTKVETGGVSGAYVDITGLEGTVLDTNHYSTVYVTFMVKNDQNGKMQLGGKKNIAEINGYKTYYDNNQTIPDSLDKDNNTKDIKVENKPAGLIDKDSNPGNLTNKDLNKDGIIISDKDKPWLDREEDDTDQAPTLNVHLDENNDHTRKFNGYVFEDTRDVDSGEAKVGNGNGENETKVNGVTLELVELVPEIDPNTFIATGNYLGEYEWVKGNDEYYSGKGTPKTVINDGINAQSNLSEGDGQYEFRSMVAGDYYIRFKYGDTYRTVLTNDTNSDVNKLVKVQGSNAKSYNGQDYKSTVYQSGIDQASIPVYNGIKGFVDYDNQNVDLYDGTKNTQYVRDHYYVYNIQATDAHKNISDAKDIYQYRENCNNWSKGADGNILLNSRAEQLASFDKVLTGKVDATTQINAINEMMKNTQMVAQTGVINTEIEYDRTETTDKGDSDSIYNYTVADIDFGLVERAKAVLTLNKEVEHIKVGKFDTTKQINNFTFEKHTTHDVTYDNSIRLVDGFKVNKDKNNKTPEILQLSVDDELINNATLEIRYAFKVENKGEVDYKDKQFYYTGITTNAGEDNIVKTNVEKIIDYPTNELNFDPNSNKETEWTNGDKIIEEGLVNNSYAEVLNTYNNLLTTTGLSDDLTPEISKVGTHSKEGKLTLSTKVDVENSSLVYNNLAEIVATSNDVGRRNVYSISGNQQMADQSLGDNAGDGYASTDRIEPEEIDADSAQLFKMIPPTGSDVNYLLIISGIIVVLGLIVTSGIFVAKGNAKVKM